MELQAEMLAEAIRTLPEKQWPIMRRDVRIPGLSQAVLGKGEKITAAALEFLRKNRVAVVDAAFGRSLLETMHRIDPVHFPLPHQVLSPEDFSQEVRFIEFANRHSRYQRQLISTMEVEGPDGEVLLHYNERLDHGRWGILRRQWPKSVPLAFRYSEFKILLFLNLRLHGGDAHKRFLHNVRIVETLSRRMHEFREFINLSKLSFERDVLIVDEPEKLLEVYQESDVRLTLVGDGIEPDFREALVRIKKFDPYARFMLAKTIDPADEAVFLLAVEGNYSRDNWK